MRQRLFVTAKIHRATVTDANADYKGSIAICPELIAAAGLMKFEFVHINNVNNGNHWETYVIPGDPQSVVLNGPPAHLFSRGDIIVINRIEHIPVTELGDITQTVVYVDAENRVTQTTCTPSL
jgi:aspartate 1-decarboxylase